MITSSVSSQRNIARADRAQQILSLTRKLWRTQNGYIYEVPALPSADVDGDTLRNLPLAWGQPPAARKKLPPEEVFSRIVSLAGASTDGAQRLRHAIAVHITSEWIRYWRTPVRNIKAD